MFQDGAMIDEDLWIELLKEADRNEDGEVLCFYLDSVFRARRIAKKDDELSHFLYHPVSFDFFMT